MCLYLVKVIAHHKRRQAVALQHQMQMQKTKVGLLWHSSPQ